MSTDLTDPNLSRDPGGMSPASPAPEGLAAVILARKAAPAPSPAAVPARGRDRAAGITHEARRRIGRNLRLLYAEVLTQPLPARFDALLADLAARDETGGS